MRESRKKAERKGGRKEELKQFINIKVLLYYNSEIPGKKI